MATPQNDVFEIRIHNMIFTCICKKIVCYSSSKKIKITHDVIYDIMSETPRGWLDFKSCAFKTMYNTAHAAQAVQKRVTRDGDMSFNHAIQGAVENLGFICQEEKPWGSWMLVFVGLFFRFQRSRKSKNNGGRLYIFFFWLDLKLNELPWKLSIIPQMTAVWGHSLEQNQNGLENLHNLWPARTSEVISWMPHLFPAPN